MACEEFSLNWNDHHETLVAVFEKLLERSTLVDCTLAAEGQYLKAHKVILSACSPYFELLFSQEKEKNPIIILKDIKFRELKAMIEFVYRGTVKIPEDHLQDFVDAAESLQIKGLGLDQKSNNSGKRSNAFGNVGRKKSEFSPRPNKRCKNSSLEKNEENSPNLPSEALTVSENVTSKSHSLTKIERNIAKSSSLFTNSVSDTFAFVSVGQESHEENFPCSTDQSSVLAETETVVKTEPVDEPVPESIVPDNIVEPKKEECEQEEITIFDSDDGAEESMDADGIHDENSQELSEFPPTQEAVTGDSYALEEQDHSNTQGPTWSCADARRLVSTSWQSGVDDSATSTVQFDSLEGVHLEDDHPRTSFDSLQRPESAPTRYAKRVRPRPTLVCQVCNKAQQSPSHLAIHMRSHTGERPFKCPLCGQDFTRRNDAERHMSLHAGLKPYKCGVCEKSFSREYNLKVHQKVHTGVRPYRCGICEKTFNQAAHLQKHQKVRHAT